MWILLQTNYSCRVCLLFSLLAISYPFNTQLKYNMFTFVVLTSFQCCFDILGSVQVCTYLSWGNTAMISENEGWERAKAIRESNNMTEGQTGVAGKTDDSRKMAALVSDVSVSCVQLETVCVNSVLVRWHQLADANWVCPFPTEFPIHEHGKFL